jgi:TonB family protein
VHLSDEVNSPVTFGLRVPTIMLPKTFQEMSEPCRKSILCHELLHVRRKDRVVIIIEEMVLSVLWFHPAVWRLLGRIRLSRKQVVDHEVVRLTGSRQPYLDSLLEIARMRGRPRAVPAPLFLREHHFIQRVALLLKEASMSRSRMMVSLPGIAVLMICTVRLAAAWFPLTGAPVIAQPETADTKIAAQQTEPAPQAIRAGRQAMEPKLIRKVEPVYPDLARKARVQGIVTLQVTVDEEGFVTDVRVISGHPLLSKAEVEAVKQWRYSPTLLNGKAVPVMATVTVSFALKGE